MMMVISLISKEQKQDSMKKGHLLRLQADMLFTNEKIYNYGVYTYFQFEPISYPQVNKPS